MTVILTREIAVERAVAQLQKIGAQPAPQLLNATTRIVQPNYYFTPGGPFKVSGSSYVAWVCEFAVGRNSRVVVWVDAQTGEILGGDRTLVWTDGARPRDRWGAVLLSFHTRVPSHASVQSWQTRVGA